MEVPRDWWKGFFNGLAAEMWRHAISEDQTRKDADFIEKVFAVAPGARLLDIPCGAGRLSLELAGRGFRLTGVDYSPQFIQQARAASAAQGLEIAWEQCDMLEFAAQDRFDGAFCFGNSFGYASDAENRDFIADLARALKPDGRLVLDTYCAELALRTFQEHSWFKVGEIIMLEENEYDLQLGGVRTEYTFISGAQQEQKRGWQRMYTFCELRNLLESAGFYSVAGFGSFQSEALNLKSDRLFVVARRKDDPI
ncbi:MAG TPA: class I SAM-dependent methyltransferase [Terriglobia bacterium]|nr:class I SAM-dependent methyltransferase [Terriglobia bacterium]